MEKIKCHFVKVAIYFKAATKLLVKQTHMQQMSPRLEVTSLKI